MGHNQMLGQVLFQSADWGVGGGKEMILYSQGTEKLK